MGKLKIMPTEPRREKETGLPGHGPPSEFRMLFVPEGVYQEIERVGGAKGDRHVLETLSKALALYARS